MKKSIVALGLSCLTVFPGLHAVQAQGPRNGGEMRGGMRGRGNPKMRLSRLWRGIGELQNGKDTFNSAQARKAVALIRPWSNKSTMSDNEATGLTTQLSNILTVQQKNDLKNMRGNRQRRPDGEGGRGGSFGGAGPRGDRPGGGGFGGDHGMRGGREEGPAGDPQRMRQMMTFFRTMNPFYSPTGYKEFKNMPDRMQKGMLRRYQSTHDILAVLSKKAA